MAEHVFTSEVVEEFYNSCHASANGRFCGAVGAGSRKKFPKGAKIVPMSDAARRSNAIMRSLSAARKSKEYKNARARVKGSWADREKGQGGLRGVSGTNSKKADAARAANAKAGAKIRTVGNPNKDGSVALKGRYKTTGNKSKDLLNYSKLDRGSPERKAAGKAFQAAYGK